MKYKLKLITGFRGDQEYSIDAEEAHKAYYLFRNPEKRGVFSNGLALLGTDIRRIVPDYHGTMGWNPTHILDNDDWTEIIGRGVQDKLIKIQEKAQEVAKLGEDKITIPFSEAVKFLPEETPIKEEVKQLANKFKV